MQTVLKKTHSQHFELRKMVLKGELRTYIGNVLGLASYSSNHASSINCIRIHISSLLRMV